MPGPWGGTQDRATGFVKFGQRWYDPTTGRWTQQDAIDAPLDPGDANRYAYAGDPINNIDPAGTLGNCRFSDGKLLCGPGLPSSGGDFNIDYAVGVGGVIGTGILYVIAPPAGLLASGITAGVAAGSAFGTARACG